MNSSLKSVGRVIFFVFGLLSIIIEYVNDFKNTKTFYALIYQKEAFVKDCLIYKSINQTPVGDPCNDCPYYYSGVLQKHKIRITVSALDYYDDFGCNGLPVWYCTYSKEVFWRYKEGLPFSISWNTRNYWWNTVFIFLWFLLSIKFIYSKFKK